MDKHPVNPNWFRELCTLDLKESLEWLAPLNRSVESIVSFGCWSSEPFALIWTLDATEAKVVELEEKRLIGPKDELEKLEKSSHLTSSPLFGCLSGRSVKFILGDMTTKIEELPSNYFDLAYCKNVLYQIEQQFSDLKKVRSAISEMTRVVKPGKWVIAVEPKIGVKHKKVISEIWSSQVGSEKFYCVPNSEPRDISSLFETLDKQSLHNAPDWSYCYRKRLSA